MITVGNIQYAGSEWWAGSCSKSSGSFALGSGHGPGLLTVQLQLFDCRLLAPVDYQ